MVVACSARYEVGNGAGAGSPGITDGDGGTASEATGGAAVSGGASPTGAGGGAATTGGAINQAGGVTAAAGAPAGLAACIQEAPVPPTFQLAEPSEMWRRLTTFLYGEPSPAPAPYLPQASSFAWVRETALKMLHGELSDAGLPAGAAPVLTNLLASWIPDRVAAERYAEPLLAADATLSSLWWAPDPDEPHRIGLLTDRSLLAERSSISLRGSWLNTHVFCTEVPSPPAGAFAVPRVPGLTGRQELAAAFTPSCVGCHALIDPPGFSLEHFDAMGEYRTTDEGQPIDASGFIAPTQTFEYAEVFAFTDIEDLAVQLGDSCVVGQCFARQVWTDAVERARRPLAGLEPWPSELDTIQWKFAGERHSIDALISAVVTSPSFAGTE